MSQEKDGVAAAPAATPENTAVREPESRSKDEGKLYTKEEVDGLLARKMASFDGIDMDEYQALKEEKAQRERESLEKRGEFDKILAQTVKEKDEVIGQKEKELADLGEQLTRIHVDKALLAAASQAKAINPQQIVMLLKGSVHYDRQTDSVEIRENGSPLYKGGRPVTLDQFVGDFLAANPHFLPAGPSGGGAAGDGGRAASGDVLRIGAAEAKDPVKYRAAREQARAAGQKLIIERA